MNPAENPLSSLTAAELEAIARAKRPARHRDSPPKAGNGYSLPFDARLWYVAEFIHQARLAKRSGNTDLEQSWRERAQDIAESVAIIYVHAPPDETGKEFAPELLRRIANALEGMHLPSPMESDQRRVLAAVNQFCSLHPGKLPSRRQLIEMGVRGEDITEVFANLKKQGTIRFPKEKRGPKPGN